VTKEKDALLALARKQIIVRFAITLHEKEIRGDLIVFTVVHSKAILIYKRYNQMGHTWEHSIDQGMSTFDLNIEQRRSAFWSNLEGLSKAYTCIDAYFPAEQFVGRFTTVDASGCACSPSSPFFLMCCASLFTEIGLAAYPETYMSREERHTLQDRLSSFIADYVNRIRQTGSAIFVKQ
jgi:hypothetical protein